MTGHVVATCDLPQPAAPTPHGWTRRRAPAGRSQSTGQEQRDEGLQCPRRREPQGSQDESPIAQEENAGEVEDKEGFESASEEAGGLEQSDLRFFSFCFFCFVLSGGFGEKEILGTLPL